MPANDPSDLNSDEKQEVIDSICHYLAFEYHAGHDSITPRQLADRVQFSPAVCEWALDELAQRNSRVRWRVENPSEPKFVLHTDAPKI